MQIAVLAPGQVGTPQQLDGRVAFDGAEAAAASMLVFTPGKKRQRIFMTNLPITQFAPARTATSISISGAGQLNETFAIDHMDSLMKVMNECVADLRQVWNASAAESSEPKLKQRAKGELQRLIRPEHYPELAMSKDQEGSLRFALLIDETGRVADCTIIETSGVASLDVQSCAVLRGKARFTPAIGMDGKPAKDTYVQSVTWRIAS
ncbi:MAG TPA: energy transducer TonB [Chloroflexota bacterium]|nr:energy transducer TonB [Chloroflexota bacterium]